MKSSVQLRSLLELMEAYSKRRDSEEAKLYYEKMFKTFCIVWIKG